MTGSSFHNSQCHIHHIICFSQEIYWARLPKPPDITSFFTIEKSMFCAFSIFSAHGVGCINIQTPCHHIHASQQSIHTSSPSKYSHFGRKLKVPHFPPKWGSIVATRAFTYTRFFNQGQSHIVRAFDRKHTPFVAQPDYAIIR